MLLGIASGPAIGMDVADVEEFVYPDSAAGITEIAVADIGVAFAFEEDHLAHFLRMAVEKRDDGASGHGVFGLEPGEFEEGGAEIGEIDEGRGGAFFHTGTG